MTTQSIYAAGDTGCVIRPIATPSTAVLPLVVWCHGHGTLAKAPFDPVNSGEYHLAHKLAAAGFVVVTADLGGTVSWGSAAAQAKISPLVTTARASWGASSGKFSLVGVSMGHTLAVDYAAANPTLVAKVAGILPVTDMEAIRTRNPSGFRAEIDTAWGVVYPAALPAGANPNGHAADLVSAAIGYKAWGASDDTISTQAEQSAFATAAGGTLVDLGALGHTEAAIDTIDAASFAAWLA